MSQFSEQEKVKGIPLFFFFLVVFNLGILFMERSLLPTCLLLLHLSPFRFLKIAKNTEYLSLIKTLTGKKGLYEDKKIYIYTVSPAVWLPAHIWASVLSGYLNWHMHARSKEDDIKGTAGSMLSPWTQCSIFERWVLPPLESVYYHRPLEDSVQSFIIWN